jgi:hypothetical protein
MADEERSRERYSEAFWRAHHEAWRQSDLNQREYCEAQGLPLKAFGNWRAKFKAEPQPPPRKLLYRRGGLSHTLSHSPSHTLSHVTYPSSWSEGPVVPPARDGHRRRFSEADKRRILEEAAEPNASLAKIARRYGIARRVLCRWKQGPPLPSWGRRNSPPPPPKPRGGLAALAGGEEQASQGQVSLSACTLRSGEKTSTAAAGWDVNRNADQGAAPARPRTRAAREPAPWW